jgi:hypothetical protein
MCVKYFLAGSSLFLLQSCTTEQGEVFSDALSTTFTAAGAYYGGRAQGYSTYQPVYQQHGTMNTLIGGQPGFINY